MKKLLYPSLFSLMCLVLLAVSAAQSDYLIVKDVFSTSGGQVESANYLLDYSTGQVAVGRSVGTAHIETGGFWGWGIWVPDTTAVEERLPQHVPSSYVLFQNYPNPFNPETRIGYQLPEAGHVCLVVFNVTGQEVCRLVDGDQTPGEYLVTWDGRDGLGRPVASGIYFYRLTCGEFQQVRKMLLLK
jgi:hypothetical protein